jgi:hypothetical protein
MLTLNPTTLFYFSLRDLDGKDKNTGLIKDWAKQIPHNVKPGSTHSKLTPSLTQGSTRSSHAPPSTWSALNTVKISHLDDGIEITEGNLSDFDKIKGNEWDAAIKSPPKGKQRITSSVSYHLSCSLLNYIYAMWQALVMVEDSPKHTIPQIKWHAKPTNDKLPKEWLKDGVWCKRIIPSMFCWAGIQENPWVISDESIAVVLTKICEVHFGDLTESPITPNGESIRVVSAQWFSLYVDGLIFYQVLQQLSEWRSSFGSATIAIVNAFFDGNNDYQDLDSMRQEFATYMLEKLQFVYWHHKGNDKTV